MKRVKGLLVEQGSEGNIFSFKFEEELNNTTLKLFHSRSDRNWTPMVRGKLAVKLHDHGNGIVVKHRTLPEIDLDYSEAAELFMLLREYVHQEPRFMGKPPKRITLKTENEK